MMKQNNNIEKVCLCGRIITTPKTAQFDTVSFYFAFIWWCICIKNDDNELDRWYTVLILFSLGVYTLILYRAQLNDIKEAFLKRLNRFRILYMSLLVQEEQAALHILENKSINSLYLSDQNTFVFGERFIDDPVFCTKVDVTDCIDSLFNIEETLNELKRILILKGKSATQTTFTDLIRGKVYYIKVRAYKQKGKSRYYGILKTTVSRSAFRQNLLSILSSLSLRQ